VERSVYHAAMKREEKFLKKTKLILKNMIYEKLCFFPNECGLFLNQSRDYEIMKLVEITCDKRFVFGI
jgi:hypothetical protein